MRMKAKELREMSSDELKKVLVDLKRELISVETAGRPTGKIKKTIARILTILHERGEA